MEPAGNQSHNLNDRGTIRRIYLENFVTYDKIEIFPGSNLNVIIGPNGTGKSTIVCAIVLGLGGKPAIIGRGSTLAQYVKFNRQSALIQIELKDADRRCIKIVRAFNTKNESTWKLDNKVVSTKEILKVTESLNIRVDNLCQLLPQDKVQDFSKMNAQQLLESTQKSVGDLSLLERHNELKELAKQSKEMAAVINNKSTALESEKEKCEAMKESVGSIKEKKNIRKKLNSLQQKRAWMRYEKSRKHLCEAAAERDEAATEVKKLESEFKPIEAQLGKLKSRIDALRKETETYHTDFQVKIRKVEKTFNEIKNKTYEIREAKLSCEHRIKEESERDQEIAAVVQQKDKLSNDLKVLTEEVGSGEKLMLERDRLTRQLEAKRSKEEELKNVRNALICDENQVSDQIELLKTEIKAASDVPTKRLDLLRSHSADAYTGVLWLRQNLDKFAFPVHEPMLLTIHAKDLNYSKYLETVIPYRDLLAFVCEDKSDMNRLMKCLRDEQDLQINVVYSDPNRRVDPTPNLPIEHLHQYGFQHYLVDLVEAPPTIMNYLLFNYHIHNIPLGTNMVEQNLDRLPSQLRMFFTKDDVYCTSTSKYSATKSTSSSAVEGNGLLSLVLDTEKLQTYETRLAKLTEKRKKLTADLNAVEADTREMHKELDELRSARQQLQRNCSTIETLKARINLASTKIRNLQAEKKSLEEINADVARDIQKLLGEQSRLYPLYNSQLSDCVKFFSVNGRRKHEIDYRRRVYRAKKLLSDKLSDKYEDAKSNRDRLEQEVSSLRDETRVLYERARQTTEGLCPKDKNFKTYQTAFAKLPSTRREIDREIEAAQAKVYCLGNDHQAEQILRNFEEAEAKVRRFTKDLENLRAEEASINGKIEQLRPLWITPLTALIARIHTNFSTYFNLMGCSGEVTLKTGESIHDYEEYGMKIRVKFRDGEELQELSRHYQSGGERAVTTAIYLIALQELSTVPFRCVDEINQGMDSTNERRIFDLIVKITGKASSCQYFLLTPKLLPNLVYGEHATVHCVYNGLFMIPHTKFTIVDYCDRIKRR